MPALNRLPTGAALLLALSTLAGCHESALEPATPDQVWELERGVPETTYAMAPVPAVIDPAPVPRDRRRSVSLGYVGDAPLAEAPYAGPRWPYVQEPFHYVEPYGARGYRRGHWAPVARSYATAPYGAPSYRTP